MAFNASFSKTPMRPPIFDPCWAEEVVALYRNDMREMWDSSIELHVWNQYHNQIDLYLFLAGDTTLDILDVGCAQGTLALLLAEAGHRVWALDIRKIFLDYAKSRYTHGDIRFLCGNILDFELDRTFDLVFANQIIEHVIYPIRLVKRLKDMLRKDGRLVVTTPNGRYLRSSLISFSELGNPSRFEARQFTAGANGHFFAYLGHELITIFRNVGFKNIEVSYFESPFISGHMKLRYIHRILPAKLIRALDRSILKLPAVGERLGHQIMIVGSHV